VRFIARAFALCLIPAIMSAQDFRVSLSVSPFLELLLSSRLTFSDGSTSAATVEQLQRLFVSHGSNEVYARIATTQKYSAGFGDHSMDRGLERARLAAALKLPFNPELGLFNIYGDIRCQPPPDFTGYPSIKLPGPWHTLTVDRMAAALREYGAEAARQIVATGVHVRIWDVGNEIELGVAGVAVRPTPGNCDDTAGGANWYRPPDAVDPAIGKMSFQSVMQLSEAKRIDWLKAHLWPHEAKLLAAVAAGIRSVDPQARFSTHVSGIAATAPALTTAFFQAMHDGGFSPDELGISYYPTSSPFPKDRLQAFKDVAIAAHRALGRPIFIAEFGYPAAQMSGIFTWNDAVAGYPQTDQGQADFIRDLIAWGKSERVLSGIRYWAPDLAVSQWAPMALFHSENKVAKARAALDAFRSPPK
jgi:hypothetical protein